MFDDIAILKDITIIYDEIGNPMSSETNKEVFVSVSSVYQSEFFSASVQGIKATFKLTMCRHDYSNEIIVEYGDKDYSVYRTFVKNVDTIELYLTEKAGVR